MLDLIATLAGAAFLVGATALAVWVDGREARGELGRGAAAPSESAGSALPLRAGLRLVVSR